MDGVGGELAWRVHALALAKQMRAADPWMTSQALADAISAEVSGAPLRRDPILQRIRSWERTDALPVRRRATRAGLRFGVRSS